MKWLASLVGIVTFSSLACADAARAKEHFKRGHTEYALEHYPEAIAAFEAGFREEPEPDFLYNIGQAHAKAGDPKRAIAYFRKFLQLDEKRRADHEQVRREIDQLQQQIDAQTVVRPVELTPRPEPAARVEADRRTSKRTAWIVGGSIGGVVIVGLAVGLGIGLGVPRDPRDPTASTLGVIKAAP